MDSWEQYQQYRARQDLADIAQYTRNQQREPIGGYRPQPQVTHVNIDLTPVVMLVRAWNRFARRHLPKPVRVTVNTVVIVFILLVALRFVLILTGH
jgi:hypothetical protein